MKKKITLEDSVEFMYLEKLTNNDEVSTIQEVQTVKDIIDDWYGECCILPSNDTFVISAVINHQTNILDKIGGEKADIESLMEFLVKETGYKTAC